MKLHIFPNLYNLFCLVEHEIWYFEIGLYLFLSLSLHAMEVNGNQNV